VRRGLRAEPAARIVDSRGEDGELLRVPVRSFPTRSYHWMETGPERVGERGIGAADERI